MTQQSDPRFEDRPEGIDESSGNEEQDERARKRQEIGLSPRRPTASGEPARPTQPERPPQRRLSNSQTRLLIVQFIAIAVVTILLGLAKYVDSPTSWAQVRDNVGMWLTPDAEQPTLGDATTTYPLYSEDDFGQGQPTLPQVDLPGQYLMGHVPTDGVYRMRIWPQNLTWSTLPQACHGPILMQMTATIAQETPSGYAGLLGRRQDDNNFYMFVVDGEGQYSVMLVQDGEWIMLQEWVPLVSINLAGKPNLLTVEDDGQTLHFAVNDQLLFESADLQIAQGGTALVGGASDQISEVNFDQYALYAAPCTTP